jgi:uncharacterized protein
MDPHEAIAKLREHEAELKSLGVEHLYLFGSTVRGDADAKSDVDLFFDYQKGTLGLLELIGIEEAASQLLGCKADVMPRDSLNHYIRPRVEADAVRVF